MIYNITKNSQQSQMLYERITCGKYIFLKQFPNKPLLSKSKALKLKANLDFFDERCHLLIEYIYLLLKVQIEKSDVFISKNIFINYNSQIYMFYTYDSQYSTKLCKVCHGNLLQNISQFFKFIFTIDTKDIHDYEKRLIYLDLKQIINSDFRELNQRENQFYQIIPGNNFQNNLKSQIIPTVLVKFQNSKLFKEYNYLLKYKTAILIRALLNKQKQKQIYEKYVQLIRSQSLLFQKLNKYSSKPQIEQYIDIYIRQIMQLLSLLQKHNYINIYQKQVDLSKISQESKTKQLNFYSNLARQISINLTNKENSSQSSISNDENISQESKNALRLSKQLYQDINRKKNINFSIMLKFNHFKYEFEIIVEGIIQWKIQQFYYCIFNEIWNQFINNHMFNQMQSGSINYKSSPLQMFTKDKNVGLRQVSNFSMNCNIIQDIIITYDKIIGYFLLLENILKNIYKCSQHQMKHDSIKTMHNSNLIQNLLLVHQQAVLKYEKYRRQLIELTKYI